MNKDEIIPGKYYYIAGHGIKLAEDGYSFIDSEGMRSWWPPESVVRESSTPVLRWYEGRIRMWVELPHPDEHRLFKAPVGQFFEMKLAMEDGAREFTQYVVNAGIDSYLTGFTKSKFQWVVRVIGQFAEKPLEEVKQTDHVLQQFLRCSIALEELEIVIRRCLESGIEELESLADDIVLVEYGYES